MPLTVRNRRSPFWQRSNASKPDGYLPYNHMLMAINFDGPEDDYRHLKRAVQLWDVGCERQIEIKGPDAKKLVQMSTPRDISKMADNQCFYIPTVDSNGFMTNDPVLVKVSEDRYWVSIADSDLILFYKGFAAGAGLDVSVHEPDVAPLGIQGPKADELVARVWGDEATKIGFFRHTRVNVDGIPMILARSGYSLQGGYELYFEGTDGSAIWDRLMEAGKDLDVRAGSPCQAERVEGGLLSYLSDITPDMTPFEAGLGKFCHLDTDTGCIGLKALRAKSKPSRQIRPLRIEGGTLPPMATFWDLATTDGKNAGRVSSAALSYDAGYNVGIGLIHKDHWNVGTQLIAQTPDGERKVTIEDKFWGR